jgi:TPR repeat protein
MGPAPKAKAPIESTAALFERVNLLLRIGNVQGARALLADAVKARSPEAIAELGRTYDPNELAPFLVPPGMADPAKAAELYAEAARLGSAVARTRLERLNAAPAQSPAPARPKP